MTKTTVYASIKEDFGITNTVPYANIHSWKGINPFPKGQHNLSMAHKPAFEGAGA